MGVAGAPVPGAGHRPSPAPLRPVRRSGTPPPRAGPVTSRCGRRGEATEPGQRARARGRRRLLPRHRRRSEGEPLRAGRSVVGVAPPGRAGDAPGRAVRPPRHRSRSRVSAGRRLSPGRLRAHPGRGARLTDRPGALARNARRHWTALRPCLRRRGRDDLSAGRHGGRCAGAGGDAVRPAARLRMTGTGRGFTLSVLGVRLAVAGELAVVVDALDRYVLPWVPRAPIDGEPADRLVEVRRPGDGDGLEIVVDGEVTGRASGPLTAVPAVQRALDDAVVQRQKDFAVVHSGVVAHDGGAVLLPGSTGSGKSTLVAELVRRGALYLSDEYALVDGAGDVHPYPRSLL